MVWPFSKIKSQQQLIIGLESKVKQLLTENLNMDDWNPNEFNGVDVRLEGSMAHIISASLVQQFKASDAVNYIEFRFEDRTDNNQIYTMLMQKEGALSPALKNIELEKKNADLEKQVSELKSQLEMSSRNPAIMS